MCVMMGREESRFWPFLPSVQEIESRKIHFKMRKTGAHLNAGGKEGYLSNWPCLPLVPQRKPLLGSLLYSSGRPLPYTIWHCSLKRLPP